MTPAAHPAAGRDVSAEAERPGLSQQRPDYVIVGAGPAGCVLAGRLAATGKQVLLIEAGRGGRSPSSDQPSFFEAVADEHGAASLMVEKTAGALPSPYWLGRGIGGGSAVNAMIATPGSAGDYDHWERDLGCDGWGWSSLRWTLDAHALAIGQAQPDEWGTVDRTLIDAALSLGHERSGTDWRDGRIGVGPAWLTRRDRKRVSAADAYLPFGGDQLSIRAGMTVDRVVLDGRRAVGVTTADGELVEAAEVIVAAGAINSPAILLRSGVMRAAIGHGLKDHPTARLRLRMREPNDTRGLAASTLLRWSSTDGEGDLQLLPLNHLGSEPGAAGQAALVVGVMAVHSTGVVELTSDDPAEPPRIRLNLLDDERDRRSLRQAARHMADLVATAPFRRIAEEVLIDDRGTLLAELADEGAAFDQWLSDNVGDYFHAACTCRMGTIDNDSAVVDTAGRVHGYEGLRVCDASVFPDLPPANPYLPTVMVAEHIAAMINAAS